MNNRQLRILRYDIAEAAAFCEDVASLQLALSAVRSGLAQRDRLIVQRDAVRQRVTENEARRYCRRCDRYASPRVVVRRRGGGEMVCDDCYARATGPHVSGPYEWWSRA